MVIASVCRLVRGVGSDKNETACESESDIGIGERAAIPGRVSELMRSGRPGLSDAFLLEPGARRVKPGSAKAGQKAVGVWGDTSLDVDKLVRRVRLTLDRRGEGDLDLLTSGRGSPAALARAQNRSMS